MKLKARLPVVWHAPPPLTVSQLVVVATAVAAKTERRVHGTTTSGRARWGLAREEIMPARPFLRKMCLQHPKDAKNRIGRMAPGVTGRTPGELCCRG